MSYSTVCVSPATIHGDAERVASRHPVCHITYTRDTWVTLLQPLSEYAFHEAKLLCQESEEHWMAWVPDFGSVVLHRSDFYC